MERRTNVNDRAEIDSLQRALFSTSLAEPLAPLRLPGNMLSSLVQFTRDVSDEECPQLRAEIAPEIKTGLVLPAPPSEAHRGGVSTRNTFNPTSPRAPVPLLTYVKEWVNLPISDVLAQLKRYLRVILAHACPLNSLLKIKILPFLRSFILDYAVLFAPCIFITTNPPSLVPAFTGIY